MKNLFSFSAQTSGDEDHSWVLDGYKIIVVTTLFFVDNGGPELVLDRTETVTSNYNHFNWGWYGENNGYFLENVYNTSSVQFPDTNVNGVNMNFNVQVEFREVSL